MSERKVCSGPAQLDSDSERQSKRSLSVRICLAPSQMTAS